MNATRTPARYVSGFMFNDELTRVALIRKNKPEWQNGKLNGIGGKIEQGELTVGAMFREFFEETGVKTKVMKWIRYLVMRDAGNKDFSVDFFCCSGNLDTLHTTTDEEITIVDVALIHALRTDMIENLPWLIALAVDVLQDGRPSFTEVFYPSK